MAGEPFTITPRGPFSLAEAAMFGFGQRDGGGWDGVMRMAFCLVVVRGTGFTDVLPVQEPRVLALTAQLYQLDGPPGPEEFARLAEPWRPFRTWAVVLIRAAAGRIPGEAAAQTLTAVEPGPRR